MPEQRQKPQHQKPRRRKPHRRATVERRRALNEWLEAAWKAVQIAATLIAMAIAWQKLTPVEARPAEPALHRACARL